MFRFDRKAQKMAVRKVVDKRKSIQNTARREKEDPRLGVFDDEMHSRKLQQEAMKSLHLLDDVAKTDEGWVVT